MIRLFALALVLWAVLLTAAVFSTFYWHVGWGVLFLAMLVAASWLLARKIEREGRAP